MMNKKIYEAMEREFEKSHLRDDVDDVLLELSEMIADSGLMNKEVKCKQSYGRTEVEACGICLEEDDEVNVLVKWISIGKKKIEIDDYVL